VLYELNESLTSQLYRDFSSDKLQEVSLGELSRALQKFNVIEQVLQDLFTCTQEWQQFLHFLHESKRKRGSQIPGYFKLVILGFETRAFPVTSTHSCSLLGSPKPQFNPGTAGVGQVLIWELKVKIETVQQHKVLKKMAAAGEKASRSLKKAVVKAPNLCFLGKCC